MPDASAIPLGLYVHLPWCVRKCPYCDFNSHAAPERLPERDYVAALLADLAADAPRVADRVVGTIFLGGGTPSLFSGAAIATLLDGVRARLALDPAAEITLEANPGAIDAAHFARYREAGVNRLSIGVQSLRAPQLAALGRIHSPEEAARAVETARTAGFENINLDLMHGLPGDAPGDTLRELEAALAFGTPHLSWYQLTLEAGTTFAAQPPALPPADRVAEEFEAGVALLAAQGYARYEISAFARAGRGCRHNFNYWQFGDYLGIGAGAHAKLTTADGRILRSARRRSPVTYLKTAGTPAALEDSHDVPPGERTIEFMLNALRLLEGFPRAHFSARTGLPAAALDAPVSRAVARGLLTTTEERIAPTPLGTRFLNDLLLLFTPDPELAA
ncbi:MAG: radical SAM family heme chaperone HemW [Gammaproteobacteria bacterium]|nr:radical SAM family heme chaperone HemW [Gammaproteobacteria bacterium]